MKQRNYQFMLWDVLIPMGILLIVTVLIRLFQWDMRLERHFFHTGTGWYLGDNQPWRLLFHYGNIPAILLVLTSIVVWGWSFLNTRFAPYRKLAGFFVIVMLLGPGFIVNTVLKDHWGRPRPRNVIEFGGQSQFEQVLSMDHSSDGKSFPCGHASMGFYLMVPFFFLRKKHPYRAVLVLLTGMAMGFMIGLARMIQGGHFLSDVIWSAGIVYLTGVGVYVGLGLQYNEDENIKEIRMVQNRKTMITATILVAVIAVLVILCCTPYSKEKTFSAKKEYIERTYRSKIQMVYPVADIIVRQGDWYENRISASGFGFPGCKVKNQLWEYTDSLGYHANYVQRKVGFFTELKQDAHIDVPPQRETEFSVFVKKGNAYLDVTSVQTKQDWYVLLDKGDCKIKVRPGQAVKLDGKEREKEVSKMLGLIPGQSIPDTTEALIRLHVFTRRGTIEFVQARND